MIKRMIASWFRWKGWKFTGTLPKRMKKSVMVFAPHTSKQDFLLGVAVAHLSKFHSRMLVNKKFFWFPLGSIIDHLGGHPFDPSQPQEVEKFWVNKFNERVKCSVVMAPEWGLARRDDWDLTFYRVAQKTESPIVMIAIDYKNKEVKFHTHFFPSGDIDRDVDFMRNWLSTYSGKNPEEGIFRLETSVKSAHVKK